MKKERLMIVGAGKFQVPIIELAKQMGFGTIVVSIAGNYPGLLLADRCYEVDVREKEVILEIAREEGICGVVTDQTDLPVPTVAYVAEKLGLPGIGYECAFRVTDKLQCREHCRRRGFPVPKFFRASSLKEATKGAREIGFPLVVKPVDSQAARGVARVNHRGDLPPRFQDALACSGRGMVLLEEFFPGKKLGIAGFISDFRPLNLLMYDNEHFAIPDLFIKKQTLTPALLKEDWKEEILRFNMTLYESFHAPFGITFSEYKVNEQSGEFRLIEAALRGCAGFVSSHFVPLVRGIDVVPWLIEWATGRRKSVAIDPGKFLDRGAGNVYFYLPAGVVRRIKGLEEVKALPGVHRVTLDDLEVGKKIGPIKNDSGRQGPVVFAGRDRKECEEILQRIRGILQVEVETPEGMKGIVWS